MNAPVSKYSEALELAVQEDAQRLDEQANALSNLRRDNLPSDRYPNAEQVAQLRGYANHLRALSAVRMRAKYQP